jgi:glycosyltransferase involved in cell wall biosynthesis
MGDGGVLRGASPLRILVLFGNIPMWGQERANIQVYESLAARGVECLFVTHRDWGHVHVQPALDARGLAWTAATYAGRFERRMGVLRWAANIRDVLRASLELLGIVRRYRPHGLHVASPAFFVNFLFALLWLRLPLVYRIGDSPAGSRSWIYRALWRQVIRRRVARFVCDSRFIQRQLLDLGVEERRTVVIYPPPPPRTAGRDADRLPAADRSRTTIAYLGQVSRHKGVHLLVEAAQRILARRRDVRFLIAGDYRWQNPFAEGLIAQVRAAGLDDAISFLGNVEDVPALLALADVHVCPTLSEEPLGLVVLEAKQAGRPSVVFPSGGLIELVAHGVDGVICAEKSAAALAEAIEAYVEDPERRRAHGRAAGESLARLGTGRFAERWQEVWHEVT